MYSLKDKTVEDIESEFHGKDSDKIAFSWDHLLSTTKPMADDLSKEKSTPNGGVVISSAVNLHVDDSTDTPAKNNLHYGVEDNPSIHMTFFFGLQQVLISLSGSLTVSLFVAKLVCAQADEDFKAKLLCTTMFMSGVCSILQTVVGIRLPLYQGPSIEYMIPLMAMSTLTEWQCTESHAMVNTTNHSDLERNLNEHVLPKVQLLEGSLMLAGLLHCLIGATGIVGVFMSYIGPVTIVPAITLVGLFLFRVSVDFSESHWGIAIGTASFAGILSLYCDKLTCILPSWSRQKGCHITRYPLHKVLAILFAIIFGWILSAILTYCDVLSDNPQNVQYYARTDTRSYVIHSSSWIFFPYPGQFGPPSFALSAFISFMVATLTSIIDSIGDYYACARVCNLPPPPDHAMNRGIMVEGFSSLLAGSMGAGHATSTYGGNIGAIGITKVGSRRVFQMVGLIFVIFGVLGKLGAIFVIIPHPVLGGVQIISFGIFIGVVLSNMMYIDMNSTRNLAIIGISLMFGLMMPHYIKKTKQPFNTGYVELDSALHALLANANFVGGALACFLDNTVPGTLKERGFIAWQNFGKPSISENNSKTGTEMYSSYDLPFISSEVKESKVVKYIPFLPGYTKPSYKCRCFQKKGNSDITQS